MFLSSYSPLIFLFSFSTLSQRKVTHLLNHPYTDIIACNKNTLLSLSSSSSSKSHKHIAYRTNVCCNILGATLFGRRLAFSTRVLACVYIEILCGNLSRRFVLMLTTELFIAIISLCITCFALGYAVGSKSNDKTQK